MGNIALSIQNAHKTYPNGFQALKGISFDVQQGEFFALLGPNGAGKTTLISAIAGLNKLSSGSIAVMNHDVYKQAVAARMNLGLVPQELVFDPFFTVREILNIQSGYFGLRNNHDWIDEMLQQLGLYDKANTNLRNLSGGMKRRVMVAQALVHKPPVIILDEPTAGVDVELRHSLWAFMQRLNQEGHTIILTTHYLEEAEQYCQRIAVMKQGQLVTLDSTDSLLNQQTKLNIQLQLSQPLPANWQAYCYESQNSHTYHLGLTDYSQLTLLFTELQQQHIDIIYFKTLENHLEQIFINLTTTEPLA